MISCAADRFARRFGQLQKRGGADDRVERIAQLVRKHGQKLVAAPHGVGQVRLGLLQRASAPSDAPPGPVRFGDRNRRPSFTAGIPRGLCALRKLANDSFSTAVVVESNTGSSAISSTRRFVNTTRLALRSSFPWQVCLP